MQTPKKAASGAKVQDSIMMLESIGVPKSLEDNDFARLKDTVNEQMRDLKKDSLEALTDLLRRLLSSVSKSPAPATRSSTRRRLKTRCPS